MAVIELTMPKMGESIMEATIINWVKNVGDTVAEDETILEIATDKVDSEIPSPVNGVISEILFSKDDVVEVGKIIARISTEGEDVEPKPSPALVKEEPQAKKIETKELYIQSKYREYMKLNQEGQLNQQDKTTREAELQKLDEEIKREAADSEQKLLSKRQELLEPIVNTLQNKINEVAESMGYTHILNQTDSGGVSTVLYAPKEDDITEPLMKALGITIPN